MDPNTPNTYDHYDVYFQNDPERYIRGYAAYEQFLAMRTYIPRQREEAEQRLIEDYFGDDVTPPKYLEENFRRRYLMSSTLSNKIVNAILGYDAQPLPEYFYFSRQRYDAVGRLSIDPILKCTSAIRQLAYNTAPEAFDEYLQIAERWRKKTYGLCSTFADVAALFVPWLEAMVQPYLMLLRHEDT
ncbi:hypothetical protein Tco_1121211 [Tanacetum coccineum]|uniref:Uncharacterized protein n=1 Tax=Tanacetum coccineum TaxID=301880 RepID=A0ABQ5IX20_9ASTR